MPRWSAPEEVGRLLFSPSGLLLATTRCYGDDSEQDALRLWDALSGRELASLEKIDPVFSLGFASERELMLVNGDGCRIWDARNGKVRDVFDDICNGGAVSPDGKTVTVAQRGGGLVVLGVPSKKVRHQLRTPPGYEPWYDDFATAGPFLAAVCNHDYQGGFVLLWDVRRGKRLRTYQVDDREVGPLTIHADGPLLALATSSAVVSFAMEAEEELEGFRPLATEGVYDLRYSADGRTLLVLDKGRLVRLDAATGRPLSRLKAPSTLEWRRGAIDPGGEKVAVADGAEVEVLDVLDA